MKLNYEVEWELEDEVIEQIVDEIEDVAKNYPDYPIDKCISETTEDNVSELAESDHDNVELYIDKVIAEVKKRYFARKAKSKNIPLPTIPTIPAVPADKLHSGYIVKMDDLGRVFIPEQIKNFLKLEKREAFEIFFDTDHNIILKKYHE